MDQKSIENEIVTMLRKCALLQAEHDVPLSMPLGRLGLGLDSLAMIQLVMAVENRFEIEISEKIWVDVAQLTVNKLVELILCNQATVPIPQEEVVLPPRLLETSVKARLARIVQDEGVFQGVAWVGYKALRRVTKHIYRKHLSFILAFDLSSQQIPETQASIALEFRNATASDSIALNEVWNPHERHKKTALFKQRITTPGFQTLVAVHHNQIVGVDWISSIGDVEDFLGLIVKMREGSCYGLDLNEKLEFRGKGVGLALLCYSLIVTKRLGFHTQYTLVDQNNEKMLSAAIHLLGFRKVGEIHTHLIAGRPSSVWYVNGKSGTQWIEL